MQEIEFNLLEEPWIRVRMPDCTVAEVSLSDALLHAHEYTDLAGELPSQDAAVLRLLLAVLHAVFYRVDPEGNASPLENSDDALYRWEQLWNLGHLPEKPIQTYLAKWRERFWLFHPERPFYQVNQAAIGTSYGAKKLNGEISESENKTRLFQSYAGREKESLTYSQAARWLLYLCGYDDTSAKPKQKGLPSPGAGWLGKLGLILAAGKNLWETLLLNLVLLKDGQTLWAPPLPVWELEEPRREERVQIPQPDNQAALLTLQSRRLLLIRENGAVTGYTLLGGDFFEKENAFCEQMTIWRKTAEKKNTPSVYVPQRHDPAKQIWREFSAVLPDEHENMSPGIVKWLQALKPFFPKQRFVIFKTIGTEYGDKDFFINDAFSDALVLHRELLDNIGKRCRTLVQLEVQNCEKAAQCTGALAVEIAKSAGGDGAGRAESARTQFYYLIDQPFRQWLYKLDPDEDVDEAVTLWRAQAKTIAREIGRNLVEQAGPAALVGKRENYKKGNKDCVYYHAAPKAFNRFLADIKKIYGE